MATALNKTVTRETSVEYDGRNLIASMTEDQKISFKLKGMKTGTLEIDIETLYKQLVGDESESEGPISVPTEKPIKYGKNEPLINLNDFRTKFMVSDIPYETKVKLESITVGLIKERKEK